MEKETLKRLITIGSPVLAALVQVWILTRVRRAKAMKRAEGDDDESGGVGTGAQ